MQKKLALQVCVTSYFILHVRTTLVSIAGTADGDGRHSLSFDAMHLVRAVIPKGNQIKLTISVCMPRASQGIWICAGAVTITIIKQSVSERRQPTRCSLSTAAVHSYFSNIITTALYSEQPGWSATITSPQSNLRRARRFSPDKTNSKLLGSHSPSMLTVRSRSCMWPPRSAALSLLSQWRCCVCFGTFLHMNFSSTPLRSWTWLYRKKGNSTQNSTVYRAYRNTANFSHTSR